MLGKLVVLVLSLVVVSVVEAQSKDKRQAYVMFQRTLDCEPFPKTDFCPNLDIKVLKDVSNLYVDTIKISKLYLGRGLSKNCSDAIRKTTCLSIPFCSADGEKLIVNSKAALAECKKGESSCQNDFVKKAIFDCDVKDKQWSEISSEMVPETKCEVVKDNTGFCPDVTYKRLVSPGDDFAKTFAKIKQQLGGYQGRLGKKCFDEVKNFACSALPVCSDDKKYAVSLVSKQGCKEIFKCIPTLWRVFLPKQICENYPDETSDKVKKVPFPVGVGKI